MQDQERFHRLARSAAAAATAGVLLLGFSACSITTDKQGEGSKKKNVDIQTPFGGLKVRTNVDPKDIGLPVYAGARQVPEEGHDSSSANVTLGIPGFGLKVIAAKFESDDPPDKVLEFYRKEMKTYGSVTECKGNIDLKGDDLSSQEITCKEGSGVAMRNKVELAVGKGSSHRIVSVEPLAKGCKFALVYLQMHGGKESTM
ncbi:MAG: hypothetical protein M3O85_02120 [Acidobacteriota bacterium]|nr:hypothetical protein [Acidobacteriota bacterium]